MTRTINDYTRQALPAFASMDNSYKSQWLSVIKGEITATVENLQHPYCL